MLLIKAVSVLAFATSAFAAARGWGHVHDHHHHRRSAPVGSGSAAPFPISIANATGIWGSTGTGLATAAPTAPSLASDNEVAAASYTTCTTDVTVTSSVQVTVTVTVSSSSGAEVSAAQGSGTGADVSAAQGSSTSCTQSTTTIFTTVTVRPVQYTNSSSAVVAAVTASTSSAYAAIPTNSSSAVVAAVNASTSSASAAIPTTFNSSTSATTLATYAQANKAPTYTSSPAVPSSSTSSSSAVSSSAAPPSSNVVSTSDVKVASMGSGKRGLAYNSASATDAFLNHPEITWAYNWLSNPEGLGSSLKYIPTLHSNDAYFQGYWKGDAQAAINAGSKYLFFYNEPDLSGVSPASAAADFMTYMQPFAGKGVGLCAPAVTNGGGNMGITWLSNFMSACESLGCHIDCINLHWYAGSEGAVSGFESHIRQATAAVPNKEVFVSEIGLTDGDDGDVSSFLQSVMPWMDSQNDIVGYAYFMCANNYLLSGNSPSSYGSTYMSYT